MDNYILMNDIIQNHQDRMMNLKRYYPFFRLMDINFTQYREGRYNHLDMGYLVLASLRFFIEWNHFADVAVDYDNYSDFMKKRLIQDFGLSEVDADDEVVQYIFDKIDNEGRPFSFQYFDPVSKQTKMVRVRLIESEMKDRKIVYRITSDAVAFYLDTKEVKEESRINIAQLLLSKLIKSRNFKGGLEVISRINMEVSQLMQQPKEIQALLNRHVQEGLQALEAYHGRLLQWFDEEQRLFAANITLTAQAITKMQEEDMGGGQADDVYALDTALKNAMKRHAELMHVYMEMQKAGDEALEKAKRTRFRTSVDFMDVWHRLCLADSADLLGEVVTPLFAPKIQKTFELSRLDELLLYKPDDTLAGELMTDEPEQQYVYADEVAEERMTENFDHLLRVLFDQLLKKESVTLAYLNYLYGMKFSEQIFRNGDYYAFLVHLSQKKVYDLQAITIHQDTFLEGMINTFLVHHETYYKQLKFRLVYLPEEPIMIMDQYEMSNIRFERMENDGSQES